MVLLYTSVCDTTNFFKYYVENSTCSQNKFVENLQLCNVLKFLYYLKLEFKMKVDFKHISPPVFI